LDEFQIALPVIRALWYCPEEDSETEYQFALEGAEVFFVHVMP
jgi:hypothetical protein